jgi:hypothetical protein
LTADSYLMNFNLPAKIRASAIRVQFRNIGRFWSAGDAIAIYWPRRDYDIMHFMNKIPLWVNLSQVRKSQLSNWLPDQWKRLQAARKP